MKKIIIKGNDDNSKPFTYRVKSIDFNGDLIVFTDDRGVRRTIHSNRLIEIMEEGVYE